jgi:catechol 2,3-dioxygenase-like lactoylglutathione lyase family enzyme
MIDHVGLRVSDMEASARFYDTLFAPLGISRTATEDWIVEWDDFGISPPDADHPVTTGLHIGFASPSREHVDRAWAAATEAGHPDDGEPGPRTIYGPDYYGGFLLDPDGNSAEAVHHGNLREDGNVDHMWIRVADVGASRAFYETIAPHAGLEFKGEHHDDKPHRARFTCGTGSFSLVADSEGRGLTQNLHLAFSGSSENVRAFHEAAVRAGYKDNGAPGERPEYHAGYYAAFVLDPDGNNIEVVDHHR